MAKKSASRVDDVDVERIINFCSAEKLATNPSPEDR